MGGGEGYGRGGTGGGVGEGCVWGEGYGGGRVSVKIISVMHIIYSVLSSTQHHHRKKNHCGRKII